MGQDGSVPAYENASKESPQPRPRLRRSVEDRWIAGVCAGLAHHLGFDVRVVRATFVLGTILLNGLGLLAYLVIWALTPQALDGEHADAPRPAPTSLPRLDRAIRALRTSGRDEAFGNVLGGLALVVLGAALLLERHGVNLRLGLVLPLGVIVVGAVIGWSQLDRAERSSWLNESSFSGRRGVLRVGVGLVLTIIGVLLLATQERGWAGMGDAALSALAVLTGAVVILTPWGLRLWEKVKREQAQAIRATERADIAAHLHDSVLQTLALIQRKADDPAQVQRLARAQERELRAWLYGGGQSAETTLAAAAKAAADDLEDRYGVPVEVVVTGDHPLDPDTQALVRALTEAMSNAVRHARPPVSAYVECGASGIEAFVRDHGDGFDLDAVPADRLGVRGSIVERIERHGGTARIRRLSDGTEVALTLPVHRPVNQSLNQPVNQQTLPLKEAHDA